MLKISGVTCAIIELGLFYILSKTMYQYGNLNRINPIAYYWMTFTVLVGIWEYVYVSDRQTPSLEAKKLIKNNRHVWTSYYPISMVLPWNLSRHFYAEYGAWADREYMTLSDNWSKFIEGSHGIMCGLFSFVALIHLLIMNDLKIYYIATSIAMGSQFMNSLLYMGEYFIQVEEKDSVNYDRKEFPAGNFLLKRPFMWINYVWLIMPTYVLLCLW